MKKYVFQILDIFQFEPIGKRGAYFGRCINLGNYTCL